MNAKKTSKSKNLNSIIRLHFGLVSLYALQILVFDAWNLITPEAIINRWLAVLAFGASVVAIWVLARRPKAAIDKLTWALVLADIGFASFNVYAGRGMSSRAVILYVLPILTTAILASRAAVIAASVMGMVAYFVTAIVYFGIHFNEGYKVELYGEVGFYCAFILLVGLATSLIMYRSD